MYQHLALFLACFLTIFAHSARGADIKFHKGPEGWESETAVVISGEIVKGDFERFISAVIDAGTDPGRVYVSSRGGAVSEAIKIGVLIRELGWSTQVPDYWGPDHPPNCRRYDVTECTCVSACVLVFVAGVERTGSYIQVHRTFLDREALLKMSITESAKYSNAMNAHVRQYLDHMSSPPSLSEIMEGVASNDAKTLDQEYVHENFFGPAANVEEWVIARCGNYETAVDQLISAWKKEMKAEYQTMSSEIYSCQSVAFASERNRVFTKAIMQALENADEDFLTDELSNYRRLVATFSAEDFVGQPVEETKMGLKLLGFGEDTAQTVSGMSQDSGGWILDDNFTIEIDDREVTSVLLSFPDEKPYMRRFLGELSIDTDLQSIEAVLGQSWRSRRPGTYDIRTKKSDVRVAFDDKTGAIRSLRFHKHWPLPEFPTVD